MNTTTKIKVVIGINDFLVGGVQRQLIRQFKLYNYDRYDITLITFFQFPREQEMYHLLPSNVTLVKFNFSGFWDFSQWLQLFRVLKKLRPDVVISSLFFSNTVLRILRLFLGYRCIAREHNTYFEKTVLERFLDRVLALVTVRIVCVSKTVAEFTQQQEGIAPEKFVVIHNGIDLEEIADLKERYERHRADFSLPRTGRMILSVARLTSQKNQENLIRAFCQFAQTHPEYFLVILGDGSLFERLTTLINDLQCGQSVFLLGNRNDIENFYCTAEFLISASKMEGLSNAYLESLAFGLPIVATKTAGTDEMIEDAVNGYFIASGEPGAIIEALSRAVNTDTMAMREAALATAARFDVKKTVRDYQDLIETVFNEG